MAGKLFWVHSPTRITLSPEARELCKLHNMSERAMAKHLLAQHRAEGGEVYDDETYDDGQERRDNRRREYLPNSPDYQYIEDRRSENYYTPDVAIQFRDLEPTPREAFEFRGRDVPTSLGQALGYQSVGGPHSQRHSFRESNPRPQDYYASNPADYLLNQAVFQRLSPDYFKYK